MDTDRPADTTAPLPAEPEGFSADGAAVLRRLDDAGRYELDLDGRTVAHATFLRLGDDVIMIPHTEVDLSRRGQGIGALLVAAVLDDLRRRGERVVPRCWYVAQYLDEHPEHLDLVANI
jgi:predicted GNAT family acetyltransferase